MAENGYTPMQITLPNGIVGRVNNPGDADALEFMRTFQEIAKTFPVEAMPPRPVDTPRPYTRDDISRTYGILYDEYGLSTCEEVMAQKRFVHLVFADGMVLDYYPSIDDPRVNIAQEMLDFVMQHRHLPFDEMDGE